MASPRLILLLLLASAFSLSTVLAQWHQNWAGNRSDNGSALAVVMGDSRRIFANHFFTKADVYFHSGYYPSIFDAPKQQERSHMEEDLTQTHDDEDEDDHHAHDESCDHGEEHGEAEFLDKPRNIIDAFGRNFYITSHSHLAEGEQREMLPWLKIAAELDPQKVQTYTVASYWLRSRLNKPKEAEQFLREGLRVNPDSYEILFELGRIQRENYTNPDNARNLWELALLKWRKQESAGLKPNEFNYQQIIGFLGALEEQQGNVVKAIEYFEALKEVSPAKADIELRIEKLKVASEPQ
ncbi:MAG: hypothetical protein H0X66_01625 [Verrucomicrobia bacterium]|nr:hypothetical protein [Verrucomicrobiota bacterium]